MVLHKVIQMLYHFLYKYEKLRTYQGMSKICQIADSGVQFLTIGYVRKRSLELM